MTAHPCQKPREVGDFALSLIKGEELGHPQRDESLPQDVLHRLPEPKICAERDRGNELGQADSRGSGRAHGPSLEQRIREASYTRLCMRREHHRAQCRLDETDSPPTFIGVGSSLERGQPSTRLSLQARHRVVGSMHPPNPGVPNSDNVGNSVGVEI